MRPIYFNGKFYGGNLNGVHRVADRMIRACDDLLSAIDKKERPVAKLLADGRSTWLPELRSIEIEQVPKTSQIWEQLLLPCRAKDGILVNLANLSPIMHRRKITMIHDAQFMFADCGYPAMQRWGYRTLVPRMAKSSELTVCVSDYSRRMLSLYGIADFESTMVIPNGVDHILQVEPSAEICTRLQLKPERFVVMFSSSKPYKNNGVVLEAFARSNQDRLKLVMVGSSREELEAAGLRPNSQTIFAGRLDDRELRGLLNNALALAFPSRTEGFGLPPLEAMLCGCPAVVSPAGAIPEACGDAALYASTDSPEEWLDAFQLLDRDWELRALKAGQGRDRAEKFTWARAGSQLMTKILEYSRR